MKQLLLIFNIVSQIIFYALIVFLAFVIITSKTGFLLGIRNYTIASGSMVPTLSVGSVIFTIPQKKYQVGDIINFKSGDINIAHRVIQVKKINNVYFYRTKGDHNPTPERGWTTQGLVLGKVLFDVPYLGKMIAVINSKWGFLLAIILPAIVFIMYELHVIADEYKKLIEKEILERTEKVHAS